MVAYENFLSTSRNPEKNIQAQIESERRNTISRNREIIKSVVKCVHFSGKQSIALRGHRDDSCADERSNKGNFLALLEVRIDAGDEPLKNRDTCHANARYSSKTIQNKNYQSDWGIHKKNLLFRRSRKQSFSRFFAMKLLTVQILNSCRLFRGL